MARGEVKSVAWKISAQRLKFDKTLCNRKAIPLPSHAYEIINPWKNNLRSFWMPTEAPHGRFSTQHATPLGKYEEIRRAARIQAETAPELTHPFLFPPFSPAGAAARALPVTSRGQGAPAQLWAPPASGPRRPPGPAERRAPLDAEPRRALGPAKLRALQGAAAPRAAPDPLGEAQSRSCPAWPKVRAPPAQGPARRPVPVGAGPPRGEEACPSRGRGGVGALPHVQGTLRISSEPVQTAAISATGASKIFPEKGSREVK